MHLRVFAFVMSLLCEVIRMGAGVVQKQNEFPPTVPDSESLCRSSLSSAPVDAPQRAEILFKSTSESSESSSNSPEQHVYPSCEFSSSVESLCMFPSNPTGAGSTWCSLKPGAIPCGVRAHRETSDDCRSCLECSRDNGCVRCPERLFLFLQRDGMSHHGTCLHACPAGHFGQRGKDVNRCMKCRSTDCEHCFSRDFCTKCKPGFQLYKGKCLSSCPTGTFAHHTDCFENCLLAPLGEWSDWSTCLRDGALCGFRWGRQTRTRGGGASSTTSEEKPASLCPPLSETQRCRMKKKCPTERRNNTRGGLGRKRERKRLRLLANEDVGNLTNTTTDAIDE